jgi:hypothetical protein
MKFMLEIKLGNEAMQSPEQIARALDDIAENLIHKGFLADRFIMDDNGNLVGKWEVTS